MTAVALLVAAVFTGCSREESNNANVASTLVLKISQGASRASTVPISASDPVFDEGWVFVTNGGGTIVHALQIVSGTASTGQVSVTDLTTTGASFTVPAGVTNVHVFGNVGDVTAWPSFTYLTALGRDITDFTEDVDLTVDNLNVIQGVSQVPLYGTAGITGSAPNLASDPEVYPVASRIEIAKISTLASEFDAAELKAIYINYYYGARNFVGGDGTARVDNGSTVANYGGSSDKYTGTAGILHDEAIDEDFTIVSSRLEVVPATSSHVWAYNLPVPAITGAYFPHIVLKLEITPTGDSAVTKYLTVKNASDGSSGFLKFAKGNIYTIADIQFLASDIFDTPEPEVSTLTVTAKVKEWNFIPVTVSF